MAITINLSAPEVDNYVDGLAGKFPSLKAVTAQNLGRTMPLVDTEIPLSTSKALFFQKLEALRNSKNVNKDYCIATDKGVFIVYYKLNAALQKPFRTFYRTADESFLTTVKALNHSVNYVAINGSYYEFSGNFIGYSAASLGSLEVDNTVNVGKVFYNNTQPAVVGFRESPLGFHVQHNIGSGLSFAFGQGDANNGNAVSGLNPVLVYNTAQSKVWKYGVTNVYDGTVGTYGSSPPQTGDPGVYAPAIVTRSNGAYGEISKRDGKNIFAINSTESCVVSVIQRHLSSKEESKGYNLDYYRDNLFRLGFTNALTMDGSNSVLLYEFSQKKFLVTPATHKYNSQTVGCTLSKNG